MTISQAIMNDESHSVGTPKCRGVRPQLYFRCHFDNILWFSVHAEFDGDALIITIPRRIVTKRSHPTPHPDHMSYRSSSSSASTASFSDFSSDSRRLSTDTMSSTFSMAMGPPPSKGVSPATIPEDDAGDSGRSDNVGGGPIDEDIYERVDDHKMDGP